MSNPDNNGNPRQPKLGAANSHPGIDPVVVDDPFSLPQGVRADSTREGEEPPVKLEDISSLRAGDRMEEIRAAAAGSPRPAVAAEERRLRTKKVVGEAFDGDDGPLPEEMALYWAAVDGELDPPRDRITYPDLGTTRILVARAYNGASREDVAMISLALVGDTKHVPFEAFQAHLSNARMASGMLQAPPPQEPPPVENRTGVRDDTRELLERIDRELDTLLQTGAMQGGDDPMPAQYDEVLPPSSGLGNARPGDEFTARRPQTSRAPRRFEPAPAPAPAAHEATPAAAKKRPAKKSPVLPRAAIGFFLLIVLSLIGTSLAYLQRETRGIRHEIGEERLRNDQQDLTIHELDNRTADVITALSREKTRVIDLRRERDGYEVLARSVEEVRKKDAETILRANSSLKADIGRVRDQTQRLESQVKSLQDELRKREAGDKTPSAP